MITTQSLIEAFRAEGYPHLAVALFGDFESGEQQIDRVVARLNSQVNEHLAHELDLCCASLDSAITALKNVESYEVCKRLLAIQEQASAVLQRVKDGR
jgi:hypothetical protein